MATTSRLPDAKHHLIVAHDVTNVGTDHRQLTKMALAAREAMGKGRLAAYADRGYFSGPHIKDCVDHGILPYVPKPMTSNSKAEGRFSKADFIYLARNDEYLCPAGQRLRRHQTNVEAGLSIHTYWTHMLPAVSAQGSVHYGQRTPRATMGTRGGDRGHAAAP